MLGNNSNNNQLTEQLSHVGARIPVRSITLIQKAGHDTDAWPGQKVECEVTKYNKDEKDVSNDDREKVQWVARIDGKYEELGVTGAKVQIEIRTEWANKEVFVMPYLHSPRSDIAVKIKVRGFPMIIAESQHKRELSEKGSLADDLHCGDLTKERIYRMFHGIVRDRAKDPLLKIVFGNAEYHFKLFKRMVECYFAKDNVKVNGYEYPEDLNKKCYKTKTMHKVNLKSNAMSMIKHFENGKRKEGNHNIGEDYHGSDLTTTVFCHPDAIRFLNEIRKGLAEKLKKHNGDIIKIEEDKVTNDKAEPIQQPICNIHGNWLWELTTDVHGTIIFPKGKGATIALNDTWAYEVQVTEYQYNKKGAAYQGKMKVIIYDHFGLDDRDIGRLKPARYFDGFFHWYALQRWDGFGQKYKPFVTVIEKEFSFKGKL